MSTASDEFQSAVTVDSRNKTAKRLLAEVQKEQEAQANPNPDPNVPSASAQEATSTNYAQRQVHGPISSPPSMVVATDVDVNARITKIALSAARRANSTYLSPEGVANVREINVKDITSSDSVVYPYNAHVDIIVAGQGRFYTYTIGVNPSTGATVMQSITSPEGDEHDPSYFAGPSQ